MDSAWCKQRCSGRSQITENAADHPKARAGLSRGPQTRPLFERLQVAFNARLAWHSSLTPFGKVASSPAAEPRTSIECGILFVLHVPTTLLCTSCSGCCCCSKSIRSRSWANDEIQQPCLLPPCT